MGKPSFCFVGFPFAPRVFERYGTRHGGEKVDLAWGDTDDVLKTFFGEVFASHFDERDAETGEGACNAVGVFGIGFYPESDVLCVARLCVVHHGVCADDEILNFFFGKNL